MSWFSWYGKTTQLWVISLVKLIQKDCKRRKILLMLAWPFLLMKIWFDLLLLKTSSMRSELIFLSTLHGLGCSDCIGVFWAPRAEIQPLGLSNDGFWTIPTTVRDNHCEPTLTTKVPSLSNWITNGSSALKCVSNVFLLLLIL